MEFVKSCVFIGNVDDGGCHLGSGSYSQALVHVHQSQLFSITRPLHNTTVPD